MCTVTWIRPRTGELALCFNRDETHQRQKGEPPRAWEEGGFLAPRDSSGGGTWLAIRRDGTVLALLNHYPPTPTTSEQSSSRGLIIPALAGSRVQPSSAALRRLILPESKPFRLLCLDPAETEARVFTWDGNRLSARKPDHGDFGMLTSSSWNTAAVVASRHSVFRRWWKNHAPPSQADLEAFHRDTRHPRGRAWAVCMSRDDARTVSLTTIRIRRDEAIMSHWLREKDEEHFAPTADTAHLPLTSAR